MSWLGLLIPVLFLTLYVASYFIWREIKWLPVAIISAGCLLFAIAGYFLVFTSEIHSNGTRIAWESVSSTGEPLIIGENGPEMTAGWTNGSNYPELKLSIAQGTDKTSAKITGSGAFLYNKNSGTYFNGTDLEAGNTFTSAHGYLIKRQPAGYFTDEYYDVLSKDGNDTLATFYLKGSKPRNVAQLITGKLAPSLESLETDVIGERDELLTWASGILIIRTGAGKILILEPSESKEFTFESSDQRDLVLQSPRQRINFDISTDYKGKKIEVRFRSPYKVYSSLPTNGVDGCGAEVTFTSLTVANDAFPCETLFPFSFGNKLSNFRPILLLSPENLKFISQEEAKKPVAPGGENTNAQANPEAAVKVNVTDCNKARSESPNLLQIDNCAGTSKATAGDGPYEFTFLTIQNHLKQFNIVILILSTIAAFLVGLYLTFDRMPPVNRWVVQGIAFVVWILLFFRLLLAFRYSIDIAALDEHAVNGLTLSFAALVFLPGFFLFLARLHSDINYRVVNGPHERRKMLLSFWYLIPLSVIFLLFNLFIPSMIWSDLPLEQSGYTLSKKMIALIVLGAIFLIVLFVGTIHVYFPETGSKDKSIDRPTYDMIVLGWWYHLKGRVDAFANIWAKVLLSESKTWKNFAGGVLGLLTIYICCGIIFLLLYWGLRAICYVIGGDKLPQETLLPFFFCLISLFWIGLALALRTRIPKVNGKLQLPFWQSFFKVFLVALVTITITSVAAPILITDFGSIIAIFGLLMPLCAFLVVSNFMRAGLPVIMAFMIIFGTGYLFYQNLERFIPVLNMVELRPVDRAFARTLNFKSGFGAMEYAIITHRLADDGGLPYQELLNGNEHIWEAKAIAHEGGWTGLGFGKAPNRESAVRQDTLQFDSVFSFFVLSEFGAIGGILLLLIYVFPALLVYFGGRERFDKGYTFALILASALLIEALYHAGMNLAAFPMSGRNLPLLSVNSPSDLVKWMIILTLIGQAIFWRYEGHGQIRTDAEPLIDEPETADTKNTWQVFLAGWKKLGISFSAIFCLISFSVIWAGYKNIFNLYDEDVRYFSYAPLLNQINYFIKEKQHGKHYISFNDKTGQVEISTEIKLKDSIDPQFLNEEVARFNAFLKRSEQSGSITPEAILKDRLNAVRNLDEYNRALTTVISETDRASGNKYLFKLRRIQDEHGENVSTELVANTDFNFRKNFRTSTSPKDFPIVRIGETVVIGPAWSNNRLKVVSRKDADLTWLSGAAFALSDEWQKRQGSDRSPAETYGKLTLDANLQKEASKFVTEHGAVIHEELLLRGDRYALKLPSRVALSIISIPSGKTLALGSFPRSTSATQTWKSEKFVSNNKEREVIIPSTAWVEEMGPSGIRNYYTNSDHNFTLGMLMGSSTKPILAAAALEAHPHLDRQLSVQAVPGQSDTIFELNVPGPPWHMDSTKSGCITFEDYLMRSDNAYHINLGFLALAPNHKNLFDGQKDCGQLHPNFDNVVSADSKSIFSVNSAETTPFAKKLNSLFGINIKSSQDLKYYPEMSFRRSFWTKNTDDDMNTAADKTKRNVLLDGVSPEVVDLKFDQSLSSRSYISLLLGGGNNSFANVDLAGAFATCVLGKPVVPHILDNGVKVNTRRESLSRDSTLALRKGLQAVISNSAGTAHGLNATLNEIFGGSQIGVYAKTGTLIGDSQVKDTSRIVLAVVKWNPAQTEAEAGLVFSLVAEQGGTKRATELIEQFIKQNQSALRSHLGL